MRQWLEQQWYRNKLGLWNLLGMPVDLLMAALVFLRRFFYRIGLFASWRSPVPVVVVGNITVGGTGKTPLVLFLVDRLKSRGYRPGIISRGYGGSAQAPMQVTGASSVAVVGDEPLLMAMRAKCPVWIGQDRPAVARALIASNPQCDVIISDDGLQHYALRRDFEIVVVDGARYFGNGAMLPIGPMREPLWRMRDVDAIVINGKESYRSGDYLMCLMGERFYSLHAPKETVLADYFQGKRIHAVAGIGNPTRFFNHLRELGLEIAEHAFPDHHQFQVEDLQMPGADIILMTEKDAVKCLKFPLTNIWVLPVQAEVVGGLEDKVIEKIESFYGRKTA